MTGKMLTLVLNDRPTGDIIPGKTFREKLVDTPTKNDVKDGEVLYETYYLSLDPGLRASLNAEERSYVPPVQVGQVMRGMSVGKVIFSRNPNLKEGDWATAFSGWREFAVLGPKQVFPAKLTPGVDPPDLVGILSTTGLTAYFGMRDIGQPKTGELVVISAAAGATGSVAGQIAKMNGARVVGIAGSDEKCRWLEQTLGFDVGLNYKAPDFKDRFMKATEDLIDVYWDNVGGEILDLALYQAKEHARFVMCGKISTYNSDGVETYRNLNKVVTMRIRMQGFIVLDNQSEYAAAIGQVAKWMAEGKLKSHNTIVKGGLKMAVQAFADLFKGTNTGKLLVEVKSPTD